MIKSQIITITEIDDVDLALEELNVQISGLELLRNTAGIAAVYSDFVDTGVYEAVAKALPFPLAGTTAQRQAANEWTNNFLFSILVLTSDDCEFSAGASDVLPETGDVKDLTQKCYSDLRSKLGGDIKLTFLFYPFISSHFPYKFTKAISEIDEKVPVFGSAAGYPYEGRPSENRSLCGNYAYNDRLSMLLVSGNVSPKFYISPLTKESAIMPDVGVITAARDNYALEINNINAESFLEKVIPNLGEFKTSRFLATFCIFEEKDKKGEVLSSTVRTLWRCEDGAAKFSGLIQPGTVLSIADWTVNSVITTTKKIVEQIRAEHNGGTVLLYSYLPRLFSLHGNQKEELELLREAFTGNFNYLAAYGDALMCPSSVTETVSNNNQQENSIIACVL